MVSRTAQVHSWGRVMPRASSRDEMPQRDAVRITAPRPAPCSMPGVRTTMACAHTQRLPIELEEFRAHHIAVAAIAGKGQNFNPGFYS